MYSAVEVPQFPRENSPTLPALPFLQHSSACSTYRVNIELFNATGNEMKYTTEIVKANAPIGGGTR
jgi:hypothetical protein